MVTRRTCVFILSTCWETAGPDATSLSTVGVCMHAHPHTYAPTHSTRVFIHTHPHLFYKGLLILQGSLHTHTHPCSFYKGLYTHTTHTHISTHSKGSLQKTPGDLFRFPVRFLYKHCWLAKLWAERSLPSVRPEGHWRGAEEDKSRSPWTVGSGPFQPPLFLAVCLHS